MIGFINLVAPFFLIAYGVKSVQSNLAAILMSTTPLSSAILAHFFTKTEKINFTKIIGVIVGFAGIVITATGLCAVSLVNGPDDIPWMLLALFIQGIGTGLFQTSYMYSITGMLPSDQRGVSGSITMLTRTIGVVSGVTILTLVFSWLDAAGNEFQESFKFIFNLVGGGLFLFLLTTLPWPQVWFRKI